METADIMALHSSSPPPQLDDEGGGEAGSEEEEFGDFGGFSVGVSCFPLGFADSTDSPSNLRQPSPTIKPATPQTNCSFNRPVKQSQPTSSLVNSESGMGQLDLEGQDYNAESRVHLTNGYSERDHNSENHIASAVSVCSPREETGFADFTVFTEQAAHPWCCGFTPLGSTEKWDGRTVGTSRLGEQIYDSGQEVFMDSEPRPRCAYKAKDKDCTMVRHCEKRDAALVLPSQDHHQPQETAAAFDFPSEEPNFGEEESSRDSQRRRRHSVNSLQTTEVQDNAELDDRGEQEKSISAVPKIFSVCESVSEDLASSCDDLSFEGPSADLEPNVSSLGSEDQTDWDRTDDDDEEELGNHSDSDSFVNSSVANLTRAKTERCFQYCDPSATQETSATSNQSQSGTHTEGNFADFKDCRSEHDDPGHVQTADAGVLILGTLPPSDSFADFCAAPTQDNGEVSWAEFKVQKVQEGGRIWTQSREQGSSLQTDGGTEDEDGAGHYGVTRRNSCQVGDMSLKTDFIVVALCDDNKWPQRVLIGQRLSVVGRQRTFQACYGFLFLS